MASGVFGPSFLCEDDIDGSSLNGREPNRLKNSELKRWLACRGDSLKGLSTKAQLCKRVNEYIQKGVDHFLVDPDKNLTNTKRKQLRLGKVIDQNKVNSTVTNNENADKLPDCNTSQNKVCFPEKEWKTSLKNSPYFSSKIMREYISKSAKKHPEHSDMLPTGLQKAKAFLVDEYLHDIETNSDQSYFYYCAKCFHSFKNHEQPHKLKLALCIVSGDMIYAYCGPTCAAGLSRFCNHVLALMLKVCKYSLYNCSDVRQLKDEGDENPRNVCTSSLQSWHRSRLDGVSAQPVMEVVVSNPANNADLDRKSGITCILPEMRRKRKLCNEDLTTILETFSQHSSKLGLCQVVDIDDLDNISCVDTRFGKSAVGSYGAYQLTLTESNFGVVCSFPDYQQVAIDTPSSFPQYPSLPLDDLNGSLYVPDNLRQEEQQFINSLKVNVLESNVLEEQTQEQSRSDVWTKERKYRLTASNFGRVRRRQKAHDKLVNEILAQKPIQAASLDYGKQNESVALKYYESHMRKMGRPVKVLNSGLLVCPKIPILGCTPDARVIDLSIADKFGICEVKCPYGKMNVTPTEACNDQGFYMELVNDKPS